MSHTKTLVSAMIIETVREELKQQMQAQQGPMEVNVKYSDTDQTIRREALRLIEDLGYDEQPKDIVNLTLSLQGRSHRFKSLYFEHNISI